MCFTPNLKGKQAETAKKGYFWSPQKNLMLDKVTKNDPKHQKFYFSFKNHPDS